MTLILKSPTVVPTIGRKMWFFDSAAPGAEGAPKVYDPKIPFDSTVIFVHSDRAVSLRVTDHSGAPFVRTSVPVADYDESYEHGHQPVAAWMPYQSAQANKPATSQRPPDVPLHKIEDNGVPVQDAGAEAAGEQQGGDTLVPIEQAAQQARQV